MAASAGSVIQITACTCQQALAVLQAILSRLHRLDVHVHSHEQSMKDVKGQLARLDAEASTHAATTTEALQAHGAEIEWLHERLAKADASSIGSTTAAKVYQVSCFCPNILSRAASTILRAPVLFRSGILLRPVLTAVCTAKHKLASYRLVDV